MVCRGLNLSPQPEVHVPKPLRHRRGRCSMRFMKSWHVLIVLAAVLMAACAQQEVYTEPYASLEPQGGAAPLPVTLTLSFTVDGKPDAKRRQEILADLGEAVEASGAFKVVAAAGA